MKFNTIKNSIILAAVTTFLLPTEICIKPFIGKFTMAAILVLLAITQVGAQGSGTSTTSINITEFSFTPSTIDTTNSSQTVTITVRVTDTERDFWNMDVTFRSPQTLIGHSFGFGIQDRISGDGRDGVYRKEVTFYQYAEAGTWEVDNIFIYDGTPSYYRWRRFYTSDLVARGFATQLQVINTNETVSPEISDFGFTPTTISGTRDVTITLRARDEISGVTDIWVSFSNPEGCYLYDDDCVRADFYISGADRISGDERDGVYRRVVPVSLPLATYGANVYARDAVTNFTLLNSAELAGRGYPSHLRVARTMFDFDGDAKSDISVFRPSNQTWYINGSQAGLFGATFGLPSDQLTPADFDGDGRTDIAVYRDGTWYWLKSSDNSFNAVQFGLASDIPVPGDYTGDRRSELAVYRGGTWWMLDSLTNQVRVVQFGLAGDKPVPADYDGDGPADQAVYRGNGEWHLNRSTQGYAVVNFGLATDKLVPADYDGDGKTDLAVYRDGIWYLLQSRDGFAAFQFGLATDIPVPADYDGDGKTDAAIYRNGQWWLRQSTSGVALQQFGLANDKPVPAAYLP